MKRREFVTKAGITTAAVAAVNGCGSKSVEGPNVQTRKTVRWDLASSFPKSLDTIFAAAEVLSRRVEQLSGGKFQIRVYQSGEKVPGNQVLDEVRNGGSECGHSASYYFIGKNPALAFDTAVPFGLNARQQNAWLGSAGGLELMREVFSDFNIMNFPGGNTGVQMGGWFRREIASLQDMKGLVMRIPGQGGEIINRIGGQATAIPGGDIFPALEKGTIDATEWVGPYDDMKLGFHKIAKNYYYPGWWEPGPTLSFYVNKDAWARLPADYQAAFEVAAAEANLGMMMDYDAKNPGAFKELRGMPDVKILPFPEDMMVAAKKEAQALMQEKVAADAGFKKLYDHWHAYRVESAAWLSSAEMTYANFAYRS